MVAAGDERRTRGRAERGGVELRIAQSCLGNTLERGCRYDAAERARDTVALVVRHDEEDVGRALRWHDARRPPWFRIFRLFLDDAAELEGRWR